MKLDMNINSMSAAARWLLEFDVAKLLIISVYSACLIL